MRIILIAMFLASQSQVNYPLTVEIVQAYHEGMSGEGHGNYTVQGEGSRMHGFEYSYKGCRVIAVTIGGETNTGKWGERPDDLVMIVAGRKIAPECHLKVIVRPEDGYYRRGEAGEIEFAPSIPTKFRR